MPQVIFKRGTEAQLAQEELQDGLFAFTTDDGRLHIDYLNDNNELVRQTLYAGKLKLGSHIYDGTKDVEIGVYEGSLE